MARSKELNSIERVLQSIINDHWLSPKKKRRMPKTRHIANNCSPFVMEMPKCVEHLLFHSLASKAKGTKPRKWYLYVFVINNSLQSLITFNLLNIQDSKKLIRIHRKNDSVIVNCTNAKRRCVARLRSNGNKTRPNRERERTNESVARIIDRYV